MGEPGAADTEAMLDTVRHTSAPNLVMTILGPDAKLPDGHPANGKGMVGGKATAYVCANMTCSAPITDAGRPEDQPDTEVTLWGALIQNA